MNVSSSKAVWLSWLVVAGFVMTAHLTTVKLSPVIWQDEVQILDWGRSYMPGGDQSYAMSWVYEGRTYRMICYLGCVLQECAYRLAGGEMLGPRVSSILGAVLASFALLGWLLARGTVPWIALACSLLLLCDPSFTLGYRGARVDAWSMALMLLALWVVRGKGGLGDRRSEMGDGGRAKDTADGRLQLGDSQVRGADLPTSNFNLLTYGLAGLCAALAGAVWVSAILLLPLLIHEVFARNRSFVLHSSRFLRSLCALGWIGAFALICLVLLFLPVGQFLPEMLHDLAGRGGGSASNVPSWAALQKMIWSLAANPLLLPLALVAFIFPRRCVLGLVFLLAAAATLYTGAYVHRAIYLMPYLLVGLASAGTDIWNGPTRLHWARRAIAGVFLLMIAWSAMISVGVRNLVAWKEKQERDPRRLETEARNVIGKGTYKVYVDAWEFYYAGRNLGWQQYRSFFWHDLSDSRFRSLLGEMDAAIFSAANLRQPQVVLMEALGFTASKVGSDLPAAGRGYGNYIIYQRQEHQP